MLGIGSKYFLSAASVSFAALLGTSAQAALVISSDATSNVSCSAGVCSATASDAVLNVTDLTTMLAAGSLTVQSGSMAQDIVVHAPFSWTSSNALTLDSYHTIMVQKAVSDAGPAALTLTTNDGGKSGVLFFDDGSVSFLSTQNSLTINRQAYTLVADIKTLASDIASNPSGHYALAADYDASVDGTYTASPIATIFTGTLEGLGNGIHRLKVDVPGVKDAGDVAGLFFMVGQGGQVNNLRLIHAAVSAGANGLGNTFEVGGLAADNEGSLFNDSVSGKVTGGHRADVGGLAGVNGQTGTVSFSHSSATVIGMHRAIAGGLVGYAAGGSIANSYATGDVTTQNGQNCGGFAGCPALAGGLVGFGGGNRGDVSNSFATGAVKAGQFSLAGGPVGVGGAVSDSYATGAVSSKSRSYAGGLVGGQNDPITTSYSTGKVSGAIFGGFAGLAEGDTSDGYWNVTTSGTSQAVGQGDGSGITGLTSKQLRSGLPVGFDPNIWAQNPKINKGYPYLIDNPPPK